MGKCPGERQEEKRSCSETKGERKKRKNSLGDEGRLGKISLKEKDKIERTNKKKNKSSFHDFDVAALGVSKRNALERKISDKGEYVERTENF